MFEVKQYTQEQAQAWNEFIEDSRQGTFLFNRSYMIIMPKDFRMLR